MMNMNGSFDCSKPGMTESYVDMITLDQYELHDLATLLDLSRTEIDGVHHTGNGEVRHGNPNQPSFPEHRNMDFVNGPSAYYQRSSTPGLERSTVPRRIALVQPHVGENTQTRCRDSHQGRTPKASKAKSGRKPSLFRPILPKGTQELTGITGLQAKTLPGAQTLDSQAVLILAPQQTIPKATGLDNTLSNPPNIDTVVQSTLQNVNVHNFSQYSDKLLSSGHQNSTVLASDQVKAPQEQWYAIPVYAPPNQTVVNSMNCNKVDHNVTQKCQISYPQQHVDRSNGQNNVGRQLPIPINEQINGHEGFYNMATVQDRKNTSANSQEMQVIGVMDQGTLLNELQEYNTQMERQMHHKAKGTDATNGRNKTPSDLLQWEAQTMMQANIQELTPLNNPMTLSNRNVQISGRAGHNSHSQHINPSESVSSGTHQHPPVYGSSHPIVNTTQQGDTGAGAVFASGQPHEQSPLGTPVPRNMQDFSLTDPQSNDQKDLNGNITSPKHIARCDIKKHVAMKRKKLKIFNSLDREEKTALLREKYAELLKRRREQLQRFDPNYQISLRKMSNASRELQTLTKMTDMNCPPRLSKMVKGTRLFGKRSNRFDGKSKSSKVGNEDNQGIIIDLTGGSSSPAHEENGQGLKEMTSRKQDHRLPSYEEAIVRKADGDKLTLDVMSSVAKRLLLSSEEFFKKYHSPFKNSGEVLPTETTSTKETVAESTKSSNLDPSSGTPSTQCVSKEPTEHSQAEANVESYKSEQECQSAFDPTLEVSPSTNPSTEVLFRSATELFGPVVATSTSRDVHSKNFSVSRESNTSLKKAVDTNEARDSSESLMKKNDSVSKEKTGSPSRLSGTSTRQADELNDSTTKERDSTKAKVEAVYMGTSTRQADEPSDSTTKEKDSTKAKLEAVYMGSEKHTLKNVVVRIEDIRKRSLARTDDITGDKKEDCSLNIKAKPRRKRRINSYEWTTRKRQRRASSDVPRPRSSSTSGHHTFQDFVPTILPTRTRSTTSGQNSSSHTLAMELLQHDLDDAIDYDKEEENDDDNDLDENYSPRSRYVRRHHTGRKKSTSSVPSENELERISETNQTGADSVESESNSNRGSYQPLRVEIGKNSQNHIKLKFVNLRSISDGSSHEGNPTQSLPHRKSRKSRKAKRRNKDRTTSSGPEEFKDDPKSPCEKEQVTDKAESETLQADTSNVEMKAADSTNVSDGLPTPPPGLKKLIVNKKFGETLLHRAAKLGNMEILRYCVDNNAVDVNARDKAGYSSLHDSCVPGHLDVAEFLINHGADVNSEAYHGSRPINDAVENNHVDLVRLLLNNGADPFLPSATGRTTVQQALDQSSEMRSLMFGYLETMKVERSDLQDELEDFIIFMEQPGT